MLWRTIPPHQITTDVAAMLLARGLVPSLPLDRSSIDAARTLQGAGAPVILTAGGGAGTVWPYNLAGDENNWAYEFKDAGKAKAGRPIPTLFSGWAVAAGGIRETLRSFREAGITVDAAWLDYEGLPFQAKYSDAVDSLNGPEYLPTEAIEDPWAFIRYTRQLWISLLSTYVAAPIREVYPKASVTNWLAVLSLPEFPVRSWYGYALPMVGPTMFTATNPVAYGIDTAFNSSAVLNAMTTQRDVDRMYTEILLRQASADSHARKQIAPELGSVVWVARWVRDHPDKPTPMMSRAAYREALRHLWFRGVDAMEVFSPVRVGYPELAIQEVEDVTAVFNEMFDHIDLLKAGEPIEYGYRISNQKPVLWSGLKLEDEAIVRVVSFGEKPEKLTIEPWPGETFSIDASSKGITYMLHRYSKSIIPVHPIVQ